MSIGVTTALLFIVFGVLLFLGVPISVSIIVSSIVTVMSTLSWDQITFITMQKMNSGVESFSLLAIPLFILAGNIMNNGGIAKRLIAFAQLFVGRIPGNLAQANILGNMLFGALSGSSVAAASAMGGCISPSEKEQGYDPAFSAAANIASAPTGLLIPPTSAFIVYSTVAGGVSISTLFMAGYVPGILMGIGCMAVAFVMARRAGMKATGRDKSKSIGKIVWDAIPSLLLILIVIGGIVSGIFTATEGAGVAVLYCLILSVIYRNLTLKGFVKILLDSAKTSGIILFLISASSAMSFVMAYAGIPSAISNALMAISDNKYVIFLLMNIILMVVGMFMDITPAILIFTPIFLPIAQSLGMSDIQFGVMLIFNMCLGNITPPVGSVLFVGCGIGGVSIEKVTPKLIPYFAVLFALLLLVTYVPALSLGIPSLMGLIK
ncbi:MAG: TRAP transporter large permease [Lachnospiraceae bacterium]|nr:TRAP transporter large permease [Bacillota bacterium]MDD7252356.1 TRAP transporter large permease [Bacillota bacterium]MDO5591638.1 TRAP transporter large permease [Bacillota bacterium]MDY2949394.1 TRAP transporter large permease [Lachnospiraceae bacterium]CCX65423.1 tRAP dicarboxylate transporter DctM subunit [Firmicutes bacterium CAG:791]